MVTFSDEAELRRDGYDEMEPDPIPELMDSSQSPPAKSLSIPVPMGPNPKLELAVAARLSKQDSLSSLPERERETSNESKVVELQPSRWGRQVSWMAEQTRAITQSAMQMEDELGPICRFQMLEFWRNAQEDNFSHRNSRRPSICTSTVPIIKTRQTGLANTCFTEVWSAFAIFLICLDGFRRGF